jgi:hypothetical protein
VASQPIFAPYMPLPSAAPRPNIRIAYIAGPAQIAVSQQLEKLPAEARERTLEELALAGLADELIAAAEKLLSPAMYRAFLRWGETASRFSTLYETDEEGLALCADNISSVHALAAIPADNTHDLLVKVHLLNTEAGDCADFGSTTGRDISGAKLPQLVEHLGNDLRTLSPVTSLLDQLANMAWDLSPQTAITPEIGAIITDAFKAAQAAEASSPPRLPAAVEGYSPFMRGPLIAWRKAYADYEQARDELATYERDHYDPAAARYLAIRGDCRQPLTAEMEEQLRDVPMDEVQERFDELVMAKHDASERLWSLPAPSASELSTKLQIFVEAEGWALNCAETAIRKMQADARRFGKHGPFLQADGKILAAFAGCSREMTNAYGAEAMSREDEDAYFARLDAYEETLIEDRAATIEGVVAKLRVAFSRTNASAWSDHAIMDPTSRDFREGLRMGSCFDRMAWQAIEDLARIGGISLMEKGA